jgi:hypothetical protein
LVYEKREIRIGEKPWGMVEGGPVPINDHKGRKKIIRVERIRE